MGSLLDSLHNNSLLTLGEEGRRGGRKGEETVLKEELFFFSRLKRSALDAEN